MFLSDTCKKAIYAAFILCAAFYFANSHAQAQDEFIVRMTTDGFSPSTFEINQGIIVQFLNVDRYPHWPASNVHPTHEIYPQFDPKQSIAPGASWKFRFDRAGIWKFHDHINAQYGGSITVTGSQTSNSNNPEAGSQTFLSKTWSFLTKPFRALWHFIFPAQKESSGKPFVSVSKDSPEIFRNDDLLRSYVKEYGPKQTMAHLFELNARYGDCHQTAHRAGRFSYEIYGEKAFQECGAQCHSGCYHGATEAYFKDHGTANLVENLKVLCSSELNPFFSHQCLHGIGHGLMAWTNYELNDALKSCELLSKGQDSCFTGVFMENIVGGLAQSSSSQVEQNTEAHFTKYLSDNPDYPCNIVSDKYKASCYFLQTSRMLQLFGTNFTKVAAQCLKAPSGYQVFCFQSMGRDVGGAYSTSPVGAIAACRNAPAGQHRIDCLMGAVQDSFWDPSGQTQAIEFCRLLTDTQEKNGCYSTIITRAPQVLSSAQQRQQFCLAIEPAYKQACLETMQQ